ncbi:kelch-like protein 10 isoform X3 [Bicyclus anynana]|uniref:Kelch-like protein 10 isoform X3 n=1 Tax=Bicyclus anynana TaxID=110368 RepID=A0A6J1PAK3_BICAN|nr:kelch-like protein 10 isoform X3 [Bicyclus anynana]
MTEHTEVTLRIDQEVFQVKKELLCEYSDYFRAMFSGYYVESDKQEINIDMLEPNVMSIILKYMQMGMILLSEYPLKTIGDIAVAANFLQITELIKQIQHVLDIQLNESNWLATMTVARNASYEDLEQYSAAYGLYNFNSMKPECITSIHKLVWYLSHPHLDCQNELDVFKFGLLWLYKNNQLKEILLVLACLDMQKITSKTLTDIRRTFKDYDSHLSDSLFLEIISCLFNITSKGLQISESSLCEVKIELSDKYTERVWSESLSIVKNSQPRVLKYVPVVPIWILKDDKPELRPHNVYTFDEGEGFEKYLEVADQNLWGWSMAAWGLTKLVVVCGEHGRGTKMFMQDVKVYDTLKKQWEQISAQLPFRRHAGVTSVGDLLYILGGVGEYRVVLDTAIVYNLKDRNYRSIAKLPEPIQSPAACTHHNTVYIAAHKNIYCYEADTEVWKLVMVTDRRMTFLKSYNDYVYCMQTYFRKLYRFRPGIDDVLQPITSLANLPTAMCSLRNSLMIFTRTEDDELTVEVYKDKTANEKPRVHPIPVENMRVNDIAGSCSLVTQLPPLCRELSDYHRQHLAISD